MLEALRMSVQMLVRNPGRSGLTVMGLAIGVAAFIAMVTFGQGAKGSVITQFEELGTNLLRVDSRAGENVRLARPPQPLTMDDVAALEHQATLLTHVVPLAYVQAQVAARGRQYLTNVNGVTPGFFALQHWVASSGGLFDDNDVAARAKVCVLGATPARELFGSGSPLGKEVSVAGALTCRVVGVLAAKGTSTSGRDLDDQVLVPETTFAAYLGLPRGLTRIDVAPQSPSQLGAAKQQVIDILRRTHRLGQDDPDDFRVSSPIEVVHVVERISGILSSLLIMIASVSLLVGGIGIMNIQLVSVAERTYEIGIRAAIGAAPRQILAQFLTEAFVLSLVGTALGAVGGTIASAFVTAAMGWSRTVTFTTVAVASGFGLAVGLLFGYAPARRAARMDPIEALRHE